MATKMQIFPTIGCKIYPSVSPRSRVPYSPYELKEIWEGGWKLRVKLLRSVKKLNIKL